MKSNFIVTYAKFLKYSLNILKKTEIMYKGKYEENIYCNPIN